MSGHSKWSTIKRKKAAVDAKRGKLFSKLIKEITIAARLGGGDPAGNPRLRTAIQTARANSMPNDNIERAIKKGTGEADGAHYEEVLYEGYGPGGVAVIVNAMTDNRNRTVADLRKLFDRHGGNLGSAGCVAWIFEKRGVITVESFPDEERLIEAALGAGADDVTETEGTFEILSAPESFEGLRDSLQQAGIAIASAEVALVPQNTVRVTGRDVERNLSLLEALDDHEDVQSVASNADFDPEDVARLDA